MGLPVSVEKVQAAIDEHPDAKILAFVQAETSTGALSDAQALGALAKQHGLLTIVDAVTSLGGVPCWWMSGNWMRCILAAKNALLCARIGSVDVFTSCH